MDDTKLVTYLLERAIGDAVDGIAAPTPTELAALYRQQRRRRWSVLVVVCTTVMVAALITVVANGRRHGMDAAPTEPPSGPGVTASQLAGYRWTELPPAPVTGRDSSVAIWTGRQVIFWGGTVGAGHLAADGAAYDPATRTWSLLPPSPLSARDRTANTWAGGPIFIWGGYSNDNTVDQVNDGALYNPATHQWSKVPPAPIGAGTSTQALWTGTRVVVLATSGQEFNVVHAASYNPRTNRWAQLPNLRLPSPHPGVTFNAVAVGNRIYTWAYWSRTVPLSPSSTQTTSGIDGYTLDATTERWTNNQLVPDQHHSIYHAVWTGHDLILPPGQIYCGTCSSPFVTNGHGYLENPDTGTLQSIPPGPVDNSAPDIYWTGKALLAYGAYPNAAAGNELPAVAAWDPVTGRWTHLLPAPLASARTDTVWTGTSLIQWGLMYPTSQVAHSAHPSFRAAGLQLGPP